MRFPENEATGGSPITRFSYNAEFRLTRFFLDQNPRYFSDLRSFLNSQRICKVDFQKKTDFNDYGPQFFHFLLDFSSLHN